jgi:hypothetical protein
MPGELDPLYVAARSLLLDALDALGPQRDIQLGKCLPQVALRR